MTKTRFYNVVIYGGDTSGINPGRLRAMFRRIVKDMTNG